MGFRIVGHSELFLLYLIFLVFSMFIIISCSGLGEILDCEFAGVRVPFC